MKRIMMEIAYDGTNYCGWQIQPNGITIESELNRCLSKLLQEEIHVIGASRTDSGVHALCNIAVFDTMSRIPGEKMCQALNQRLPEDIRIQRSMEVANDFHPRFCDSIKTYQYQIWNAKIPLPTLRLYSHFTYLPLDVSLMQQACPYLIGKHDFKSFCSQHSQAKTTVRTITDLHLEKQGNLITITISGTGFLYNMVRIIVGTLMKVGQGIYPPEYVKEILESADRRKAGPVAPPNGLMLLSYQFLN
ncbi:MAG: tRNA pseudouridine(38-40) synthase TruA [Lachnospiraceae bacterium]